VAGLSALFPCSLSARRDTFHTAPPRAHRTPLTSARPDVRAAEERRRHALQPGAAPGIQWSGFCCVSRLYTRTKTAANAGSEICIGTAVPELSRYTVQNLQYSKNTVRVYQKNRHAVTLVRG